MEKVRLPNTFLADPSHPRPFAISRIRMEGGGVISVDFVPTARGAEARPFVAGQYNFLFFPGLEEEPLFISGDPNKGRVVSHAFLPGEPFYSAATGFREGGEVGYRGPYGNGWPIDEMVGKDLLLFAGGTGIVALRSALFQILSQRGRYKRIVLYYGVRHPGDFLWENDLNQWEKRLGLELRLFAELSPVDTFSRVGIPLPDFPREGFDPESTAAFVAGSNFFIRQIALELAADGVPPGRIFLAPVRAIKCGLGFCGHCQMGPFFVCQNGRIFRWDQIGDWMGIPGI